MAWVRLSRCHGKEEKRFLVVSDEQAQLKYMEVDHDVHVNGVIDVNGDGVYEIVLHRFIGDEKYYDGTYALTSFLGHEPRIVYWTSFETRLRCEERSTALRHSGGLTIRQYGDGRVEAVEELWEIHCDREKGMLDERAWRLVQTKVVPIALGDNRAERSPSHPDKRIPEDAGHGER